MTGWMDRAPSPSNPASVAKNQIHLLKNNKTNLYIFKKFSQYFFQAGEIVRPGEGEMRRRSCRKNRGNIRRPMVFLQAAEGDIKTESRADFSATERL